ncbi:hypothetical protein GQR58_008128 [Nymphon striatum]|nr:hypothetical protein GQR58_008128 [Nymphon striatum]
MQVSPDSMVSSTTTAEENNNYRASSKVATDALPAGDLECGGRGTAAAGSATSSSSSWFKDRFRSYDAFLPLRSALTKSDDFSTYRKIPVYEQSVSIVATLDRGDKEQNSQSLITSLGLTKGDLPVVIGVCVGVVLLITIVVVLFICSWRKHRTKKDHHVYPGVQANPTYHPDIKQDNNNEHNQSDTMVVLNGKDKFGVPYESYVVDNMNNSVSKTGLVIEEFQVKHSERMRPLSQPISKSNVNNGAEKFERNIVNFINEEELKSPPPIAKQKTIQSCEFLDSYI